MTSFNSYVTNYQGVYLIMGVPSFDLYPNPFLGKDWMQPNSSWNSIPICKWLMARFMYITSQDAHASYMTWRGAFCARPPIARSVTLFARNVRIIAISAASASCDLAMGTVHHFCGRFFQNAEGLRFHCLKLRHRKDVVAYAIKISISAAHDQHNICKVPWRATEASLLWSHVPRLHCLPICFIINT
jgi:hypothetical protein